ncbi:MAG: hypothetical protein COW08_00680 [Ignavibacteriales bacterium CG12_big_fil_rev_8_21_14_0_65_30_8]|nr:MAG: hypothetical protein COW08_00680 [Ignavibacteriales bacterium CG12_big_fil_rev_8_21_14_0_65_30_8]
MTGNSATRDFPTTTDAYSQTNNGGPDVVLSVLNSSGNSLIYSTYIGGLSTDFGLSIALGKNGNIFISGFSEANNFKNYPTTKGVYNETNSGLSDAFASKFSNLITSVGDENNTNILPKEITLEQNYPNPFNPSTIIQYAISPAAAGQFVSLKVFDLLGREVTTLVNEEKSAGTYTVKFNSGNLSSGIYFYRIAIHSDRLKTKNFVETKKMVLLR